MYENPTIAVIRIRKLREKFVTCRCLLGALRTRVENGTRIPEHAFDGMCVSAERACFYAQEILVKSENPRRFPKHLPSNKYLVHLTIRGGIKLFPQSKRIGSAHHGLQHAYADLGVLGMKAERDVPVSRRRLNDIHKAIRRAINHVRACSR
jgi:hypothetical protein